MDARSRLGILLLKLLRNSSVHGISMMRKLFLKKFVRPLLYKSQPYVGEENFNFCIKVTLEQTFSFAHNWSIYKVRWPQLQTLFNISNSSWRHNYPESSAFVTKKVQFCKIKVGVRYKKGETDVRVRHQRSPGSCTRDDQCLEDFFEENSLKQLQLI